MILHDDTHSYRCAPCARTGAPCMEGLWLVRRVLLAIEAGGLERPEDYDVVSATQFEGCGRACRVLMRITRTEIDLRSDLPETLDSAWADMGAGPSRAIADNADDPIAPRPWSARVTARVAAGVRADARPTRSPGWHPATA